MQALTFLTILLMSFIAAPTASAADMASSIPRVPIRVQAGNWGAVQVRDIQTVLDSVASQLLVDFPDKTLGPITVVSSGDGPRVLLAKNDRGERIVYLSVQDARWDQFAYQFSHELCHVLSNHDHRNIDERGIARDNQWFEEAVCETASLLNLERMATVWEHTPPHPRWSAYAPAFREYAQRLMDQPHRQLPPGLTLAQWYAQNRTALRADPYLRDKTEMVASALLPLFAQKPESLGAIAYLNEEKSATSDNFQSYLASWDRCCPTAHRDLVRAMMQLFGLSDTSPDAPVLSARPAIAAIVRN